MKTIKFLFVVFLFTLTSVNAQNQTDDAKRQSFGNLAVHLLYDTGVPFQQGDTIEVLAGMFDCIGWDCNGDGYIYTVQLHGNPGSKWLCVVSTRELCLMDTGDGAIVFEILKLKYIKPVKYKSNTQMVDSWKFEVVQ